MKYIRRLEKRDAPLMLEWMHDPDISAQFRYDFSAMTLEKAEDFIEASFTEENQHFAIVDENDLYLGTISLKNIDRQNENAEYAVATRRCAHGTGIAGCATEELLRYAFHTLGLHKVYLNVLEENRRANRFYEKCGFVMEGKAKDHVRIRGVYHDLNWYGILAPEEKGSNAESERK